MIREKKVLTTLYITDDGKEFFNKKEAEKYEENLKLHTHWIVLYKPDLADGYTWHGKIYVKILKSKYITSIESLLMDWCYDNIGRKTVYMNNYSPIDNWKIIQIEDEKLDNLDELVKTRVGVNDFEYEKIVLKYDTTSKTLIKVNED